MGGIRQRHRVVHRCQTGFTLVEVLIVMALVGLFVGMISGVLDGALAVATKQQARSEGRAGVRFAMEQIGAELSEVGARIPLRASFCVADTLNNVTDEALADVGTDTLCSLRSRSGARTSVRAKTGGPAAGWIQLQYHTADSMGANAICPDFATCASNFTEEHGGIGDHLLVSSGVDFWVLQILSTPQAALGESGGIGINYSVVLTSPGTSDFSLNDWVTGVEIRSFRVKAETLEMKTSFASSGGEYTPLADNVEDMQVAFLMADGTYINDGLPAQTDSIRATAVTLVGVAAEDLNLRGSEFFNRPAVEDREAGTALDRRRRAVMREIFWGRNLSMERM